MGHAAVATHVCMNSEFTAANVESQRMLVDQIGMQIRLFPAEVFRKILRHGDNVVRTTAQEDDLAQLLSDIYESWERFRNEAWCLQPVRGTRPPAVPGLTKHMCGGGASTRCETNS